MTGAPAYTFGDVIKRTGANRGQLAHWTRLNIVKPGVRKSVGRGDPRLYSDINLVETRVAVNLASFKIPAPVLKWATGAPLRDALAENHQFLILFDRMGTSAMSCSAEEMDWARLFGNRGEKAIVLDLIQVQHAVGL